MGSLTEMMIQMQSGKVDFFHSKPKAKGKHSALCKRQFHLVLHFVPERISALPNYKSIKPWEY